jgi:hypothetical protein
MKGTPKFVIVLFSRGMSGKELSEATKIPPEVKVLSYEEWLGKVEVLFPIYMYI